MEHRDIALKPWPESRHVVSSDECTFAWGEEIKASRTANHWAWGSSIIIQGLRHTQSFLKQWENLRERPKDEDQRKPDAKVPFYYFSAKTTLDKCLIWRFRIRQRTEAIPMAASAMEAGCVCRSQLSSTDRVAPQSRTHFSKMAAKQNYQRMELHLRRTVPMFFIKCFEAFWALWKVWL